MGCLLTRMRAATHARSMSAPPAERPAAGAGLGDALLPPSPHRRAASPPGARLFADYCDLPAMLGHPDLGRVVLGWLGNDTRAATALRGTCTAARDAVAGHPWVDIWTVVVWPARWRAAFPAAVGASVCRNRRLRDADFVHLRGLRSLDMSWCWQESITDGAFAHLAGIHTLDMGCCCQVTITPACRARLRQAGIPDLHM